MAFNEVLKTVGQRLKAARAEAGLDQKAVAEATGAHVKTVSRWENDAQVPDSVSLTAIAALFNTDVDWILTGNSPGPRVTTNNIPVRSKTDVRYGAVSQRIREWLAAFQLELTRARSTDDEIHEAMELLNAPAVRSYFLGGVRRDRSEEDVLKSMEALADSVIRPRLRELGRDI